MSHEVHDAISLALARRIADGLAEHPEWIRHAKANLENWSRRNSDAPRLLANYREWSDLLDRPTDEIAAILLDPTPNGQRLRQNSPFTGILSPAEVWQIKRQIHATFAT